MLARIIAWLNTIVPIIAVIGAYQISLHQEVAASCFPLIEGCTSISRAARHGDALFFFRGLMMPMSMLFVIYWVYQWRWLNQLAGARHKHTAILLLGVVSALALNLYANYLGSDGDMYRFMRRFGVTFYFAFALLAQLISLQSVHYIRHQLSPRINTLLKIQWGLVWAQWLIGLVSLWISFIEPTYKFQAENIIEWNFALVMISFYAVSGLLWKELPPKPLT